MQVGHHEHPGGRAGAELSTVSPAESALQLTCTLPFDAIKQAHSIDESCPAQGAAGANTAAGLQNTIKNSFCVRGVDTPVIFDDFSQLQFAAQGKGVSFGFGKPLRADRSALRSLVRASSGAVIGEGSLARLSAYVLDAHYSNVSKGESVNCNTPGAEDNDIHIVLGESPEADTCDSVTAEISPHFRPEQWTPDALNRLAGRPLRFTGPLFFDASHTPCTSGRRANPPRRSLFEIHPVYSVDVCKHVPSGNGAANAAQCDASDDSQWVSLQLWTGDEADAPESDSSQE
jgi:hypothetical protein